MSEKPLPYWVRIKYFVKKNFFRLNLGLNVPMFQYVASSSIMANKVFKYWSPRNQPPPRRMVHSVMSQMRDRVDRELKGKHWVKESEGGGKLEKWGSFVNCFPAWSDPTKIIASLKIWYSGFQCSDWLKTIEQPIRDFKNERW